MGTWGPKLYQNDIAEYVRDYYEDQLRRGKQGDEITQDLIKQNEYMLSDLDDASSFWFALADTQWTLGRLEDFVKDQALYHIHLGHDIKRWELENLKEASVRAVALSELEQRLLSPQPSEKKISQYKLYQCQWKFGDIYAYPLDSDYAKEKGLYGRYFLFHKIGETTYWPGHIIPIVRVKITVTEQLPNNTHDFECLEYVKTAAIKYVNKYWITDDSATEEEQTEENLRLKNLADKTGFLNIYRLQLINTSKRIIPSKLVYVGNFQNISPPKKEFIPHSELSLPGMLWKYFDKSMIDRYCIDHK